MGDEEGCGMVEGGGKDVDDDDVNIPPNARVLLTHLELIEKIDLMKHYIENTGLRVLDHRFCRSLKEVEVQHLNSVPVEVLDEFKDAKIGILLIQISDTENREVMERFDTIFSSDETTKGSFKQKLHFDHDHTGFHCLEDEDATGFFIKQYFHDEIRTDKYDMKPKKSRWGTTSNKIKNVMKIQKCMMEVSETEKT